jgi:hypothetical protein
VSVAWKKRILYYVVAFSLFFLGVGIDKVGFHGTVEVLVGLLAGWTLGQISRGIADLIWTT